MAAERVREIDALGKRLCGLKLMVPHDSSFLRIRCESFRSDDFFRTCLTQLRGPVFFAGRSGFFAQLQTRTHLSAIMENLELVPFGGYISDDSDFYGRHCALFCR